KRHACVSTGLLRPPLGVHASCLLYERARGHAPRQGSLHNWTARYSCSFSPPVTIAVIGGDLRRRTARGGTKVPSRIAQGDEGHGFHVVWNAQELLNLRFSTQVCRGQTRPQAEGAGRQEEVLHRQPERRGVTTPDNRLS